MKTTDIVLFLWQCSFVCVLIALIKSRYDKMSPTPIPPKLMQLKYAIEDGKPARKFWDTLRAEPMFDEHYRQVPGRLSCTVIPFTANGEDVWQLRVGFKTTADSKPTKFISIPVYKNGQIYDV